MSFNSGEAGNSPEQCDILVIGLGLAGGIIAYLLASCGIKVTIISNGKAPRDSNSYLAQGGIIYQGIKDSPRLLAYDIYRAGAHINDRKAVDLLTREGPQLVQKLLIETIKVPFDRSPEDDDFDYIEEGVHSVNRIIHCKDHTGKTIQECLYDKLLQLENIRYLEKHTAIELIPAKKGGKRACAGAFVLQQDRNTVIPFLARHTLLATGGLGQIFLHSTNSRFDRGDGIALAQRLGALVKQLEYIQFHPTSLLDSSEPRFLISEALRGAGATMLNSRHERFMKKYHPDWELAPRDVVARAIHQEMQENDRPCVYLDITFKEEDWITSRFPHIFEHCMLQGIDIRKEYIPVVPAAHYSCGGVAVDTNGRTNIQNLWAAGEVACTGLHGANRLASTSLLECLVWGYRCAQGIIDSAHHENIPEPLPHFLSKLKKYNKQKNGILNEKLCASYQKRLQEITWAYLGLIRTTSLLKKGLKEFESLCQEFKEISLRHSLTDSLAGLYNSMETARLLFQHALLNQRSLGCHYIIVDD